MYNRKLKLINKPSIDHVRELVSTMAPDDLAECSLNVTYSNPLEQQEEVFKLILKGVQMGNSYAIVNESSGVTYAVGGVRNGIVWFVCSKYVGTFNFNEKKCFYILLKEVLNKALTDVADGSLFNFVWEHNAHHLNLLKHLGAEVGDPILAVNNQVYYPFQFKRKEED